MKRESKQGKIFAWFVFLGLSSAALVAHGQDQKTSPQKKSPSKKAQAKAKTPTKAAKTLDQATYSGIHKIYRRAFEKQMDRFGISRIMPLKVHGPSLKKLLTGKNKELKEKQLRPQSLELVTNVEHTNWVKRAPRKGDKKVVKRTLTDFEKKALKAFKNDGKDFLVSADGQTMLGVLRAKKSCLQCHQVKEKSVLGALVYKFSKTKKTSKSKKSKLS